MLYTLNSSYIFNCIILAKIKREEQFLNQYSLSNYKYNAFFYDNSFYQIEYFCQYWHFFIDNYTDKTTFIRLFVKTIIKKNIAKSLLLC